MIQQIQKWVIGTFLFIAFYTGTAFSQTSTEFQFHPGWQQGDEATYQNETTVYIDIKEYPFLSGLWMQLNFEDRFQILSVSKKSIRLEGQHSNGAFSMPILTKIPLPKDKEQQIQSYVNDLSHLMSSLREDYEINPEGKIAQIHNKDEQIEYLEKFIDLLSTYLPPSPQSENQLETLKKSLQKNFKSKPKPPIDPFGPHNSLIYNQNFTIGSTKTGFTDFDFPKHPSSGGKGFKLAIPKEIRVEQTPRGILITEIHRLDNDWTGDTIRQIIFWTDPKNAEEIISNWQTLKMLGVTAYSDMRVTNSYLINTNSQWPEEMTQKIDWDFNTDIRVLKQAGDEETQMYPDTLTINVNIVSAYKLKQTDSHDDTSPETEIIPEDD